MVEAEFALLVWEAVALLLGCAADDATRPSSRPSLRNIRGIGGNGKQKEQARWAEAVMPKKVMLPIRLRSMGSGNGY